MPIRTDNSSTEELYKSVLSLINLLIFKKLSRFIADRIKVRLINDGQDVSIYIPFDVEQNNVKIIKEFIIHMIPFDVKYYDNTSITIVLKILDSTVDKLKEINNII